MLAIKKGAEPNCLTELRSKPNAAFNQLVGECKEQIRTRLAAEQRGVCCYCMGRLKTSPETMKVEHWSPRTGAKEKDLAWSNLLGACPGRLGWPEVDRHCDSSKSNQFIHINPTDPGCERKINYNSDGSIKSDDVAIQADFDKVLNLNHDDLKTARKLALGAFLRDHSARHAGGWSRQVVERAHGKLSSETPARPYLGIILHYLWKRLSAA